ncbi:hypothetical protein FRB90_003050, partial [Tulasnella sp. 427]
VFTGHPDEQHVEPRLCKFQSAALYGAPPALSAAAMTVVARVWYLTFSVNKSQPLLMQASGVVSVVLTVLPMLVWIGIALACGLIAGDNVRRFPQYCASDNQTPSIISGVAAAVFLLISCIFQFWTLFIVYGRYRRSKRFGQQEVGEVDMSLLIRISLFSMLIVIALVFAIIATVSAWSQAAPDLLMAGMSVAVCVVFGSQRDVLEFWHLRKRHATSRAPLSNPVYTITSIQFARSIPGRAPIGHSYGTDAWEVERGHAQHHTIRRPTLVVSATHKSEMTDYSDTEEIEMPETKGPRMAGNALETSNDPWMQPKATPLRTVRVLAFDGAELHEPPRMRPSDSSGDSSDVEKGR